MFIKEIFVAFFDMVEKEAQISSWT